MNGLFIVIPVFNGWEQTRRCLRTLLHPTAETFRVIVVDHGSTDATATDLLKEFPEVIRIEAGADLWWTGATNVGIRHAREVGAQTVMLLNNDCEITPEAVEGLAAIAEREQAVVAPVQRSHTTGDVVFAGATLALPLGFAPLRVTTLVRSAEVSEVPLIVGGRGVVIPVSVFDVVGMFDEDTLPHYWADHDFYLRCRAAGFQLLVANEHGVLVDEARTSLAARMGAMAWGDFVVSLKDRRSHRNLADVGAFFRKHYPIKPLHWVGSSLYVLRYFLSWAVQRGRHRFMPGSST